MASTSTTLKVAPRGVFAFSLLVGAICGIAAVRISLAVSIGFFIPLVVAVTYLYQRRFAFLALGAFLLGAAAAGIQLHQDKPLLPAYENVVARLADANLTTASGLPAPRLVSAELHRGGEKIPVALRLPRGSRAPRYGAIIEGFAEIEPPPAEGSFGTYCAARRFRGIVYFHHCREIGCELGLWGHLLRGRDILLDRVTESIASDDARAIAAALLFGVRSGLHGELRQKFVDAGTVHLFSVSGMHVAVVAAILLFALRGVPLAPRYGIVTALLGIYTLATGANPPAVRAFFLIGTWALCRAFLREVPAVEVLGIVGFAMLLVNPALAGDAGAQYSFFITALLLAFGEFRRREVVEAENLLMTSGEKKHLLRIQKWRDFFPEILIFCAVAFAGSVGITLFFGNDLRFGSVIANLVFTIGAVPLFTVGIIATLLPGCENFFGDLLLAAVHWCEACGEFFPAMDYGTPAGWQVALYMLALLIFFFAARRELRLLALLTSAALLTSWLYRAESTPDKVAFFQTDSNSAGCVVIVESRLHRAVCVNLPDFRGKRELEKFLRQCGVTKIEKLYLTENRRRACGCLDELKGDFRPRKLIAVEETPSKSFLDYLETSARRNDLETVHEKENGKIFPSTDGFRLDYFCARDNVKIELVLHDTDAGRQLCGKIGGKPWFEVQKKWAKNPKIWSYDVPRQ